MNHWRIIVPARIPRRRHRLPREDLRRLARHADILTTILARMSVSVSASWNASRNYNTPVIHSVLYNLYMYRSQHFSTPPGAMHLRQHGHSFILPKIKHKFNKHYFISRSLFGYVKIVCVLCACLCILHVSFNFIV